jgi:hypothetical protein
VSFLHKAKATLRDFSKSTALRVPAIKRLYDHNSHLQNKITLLRTEIALLQDRGLTVSVREPSSVIDLYHPSFQVAAASKYRYFIVTSWGHCASIWFAGSLNLHEAVLCNAGVDHPLQSFDGYPLNIDSTSFFAKCTADSFKFGVRASVPTPIGTIPRCFDYTAHSAPDRDIDKLPWYVFDEMEIIARDTPAQFIGNIHGLILPYLADVLIRDPGVFKHRRFPLINLIRHPVPRTESAIKATIHYHLIDLKPRIDQFIHEHADDVLTLEKTYKVDFSEPRARAALHVFRQGQQNIVWADEIRDFPRVRMVSMEMLQSDRDYFAETFNALTSGMLVADNTYLDKVFAPENLGSGRRGNITTASQPPLAREQYDLWSDFERAEFSRIARAHNLHQIYATQNYDLSFVS